MAGGAWAAARRAHPRMAARDDEGSEKKLKSIKPTINMAQQH